MRKYLISILLCMATAHAYSDGSGATINPESRLGKYGKYLITRSTQEEAYVITGTGAWPVYEAPHIDVNTTEPTGYIRPIGAVGAEEEANIANIETTHYVYTQYVPGESSFFGGEKLEPRSKAIHMVEVQQQFALPVYEVQNDWLRLQPGWVHRNDAWAEATKLTDWKRIYDSGIDNIAYPHPKDKAYEDQVAMSTLDIMRAQTSYDPIGNVTLHRSPSLGAVSINDITSPLRFSVLEIEGDWMKVFVARPNCFGSTKSDYREGTVGWVSLYDKDGIPQLKRNKAPCN